jgi:uncharacterized membrane protein
MRKPGALRRFKRTFLTGLFVLAPFSLTFILLAWFVAALEGMLAPLTGLLGHAVPGLGLLAALLLVWLAGALASNIVGQHLLEYFEDLLLRIPGINWLYKTIKQLAEVFSPNGKNSFKSVVLVEYPRPEVFSVGFVTNEVSLGEKGRRLLSVYIPTNHMYIGDYILVPVEEAIHLRMTLQEGVQCVISAGASLPPVLMKEGPPQRGGPHAGQ